MEPWAALGWVLLPHGGRWSFLFSQYWWSHTWSDVFRSGLLSTRDIWSYQIESNGRQRGWLRDWGIFPIRKGWESCDFSASIRRLRGISLMYTNSWTGCAFQSCSVTEKEAMGTTERQEAPSQHQETLFYCEDDWAQAQVAHRNCGVSIPGDIKKLSGHGHG